MPETPFYHREKCPACHATAFAERCRLPYAEDPVRRYLESFYCGAVEHDLLEGAHYHLCACQDCGLIYQKEIPDDELMRVLYEKWIDPQKMFLQHQAHDGLAMFARYAQELSTLLAYFDVPPSTLRVFDFGMGWGKWLLMARAFGCEACGTELSEERMAYVRSQGIHTVDWADIPGQQFDFINTEQVFEHIPHPLDTLRHLKEGLSDRGLIKISVPTASDMNRRLGLMDWDAPKFTRNSLNPVAPLEHINFFPRRAIIRMAERAGMEPVEMPLRVQYAHLRLGEGIACFKNLLLPLARRTVKKQNYLFFRAK